MSRDWKEFWANQDDPRHPRNAEFFLEHGREFTLVCGDPTGKKVLELGCGSGELFDPMGLGRAKSYRGVDFSQKMLAVFRATHPSVDLVYAEASSYVDDAKYDLIFSSSLVQYFSRAMFQRHVANARAMLAPGGRLLAVDLGTPVPGQRTVHSHRPASSGSGQRFDFDRLGMMFEHMGLPIVARGPIEFRFRNLEPLRYLLAEAPSPS